MKGKYKLEKKKRSYIISSIRDKGVRIATQLLDNKMMRKCRADEVPVPVVMVAEECMEGVQFNWVEFLCEEFLINCREAHVHDKTFHYAWFLLSILLAVGELPEDNQFPHIDRELPEVSKYLHSGPPRTRNGFTKSKFSGSSWR